MAGRRKPEEEHENHERWLISYADFITLLFAFFVVMYSVSALNEGKFRVVSESIHAALRPLVSPPASAVRFDVGDFKSSLVEDIGRKPPLLRQLQVVLDRFHKELRFQGRITVAEAKHGIMVTLEDNLLFESGQADLRDDALPVLGSIAEILVDPAIKEVQVRGHTDNVPIRSARFASNWELSSARAVTVVRTLAEVFQVSADRLGASGCAEYKPVSDNLVPESRAKNRRVELLIVMDRSQPAAAPPVEAEGG